MLKKTSLALCLSATTLAMPAFADEEREAIPQLDHVFLIVMENHSAAEVLGNTARAPFINQYAHAANQATQYFAIGHPSLPNYLHIVGGSNFGVAGDPNPKWHDDPGSPGTVVPLTGSGVDLATPAALTGAVGGQDIPAAPYIARTIADQLHEVRKSWKSYQESLPASGADSVDASDGIFSNLSTDINPADLAKLYAVKHNPFVYFESVQRNDEPGHSLRNIVGFDGVNGLYADLRSGHVPNLSLIAPNQCHDMHGLSNAGKLCANDAMLIEMGDLTVKTLVGAIKASPAWKEGKNAIVMVWDENDFSNSPNLVVMIVDTNYGAHGVQSATPYNHHSLLKTMEAGFGLHCLNHACDAGVLVMSDLFARSARR
ncbi:MAG: phosphoesterase [Chloroflexi bacterium]|nr:MAG: phosphoesterase [Chloroflexota bacterium]